MNIRTLYTAEQIQEAIHRTAAQILECFGTEEQVIALCLLNGAIWYTARPAAMSAPELRAADHPNLQLRGDGQHRQTQMARRAS